MAAFRIVNISLGLLLYWWWLLLCFICTLLHTGLDTYGFFVRPMKLLCSRDCFARGQESSLGWYSYFRWSIRKYFLTKSAMLFYLCIYYRGHTAELPLLYYCDCFYYPLAFLQRNIIHYLHYGFIKIWSNAHCHGLLICTVNAKKLKMKSISIFR